MRDEIAGRAASRDELPALARCLAAAMSDDPFPRWAQTLGLSIDLLAFFTAWLEKAFERRFSIYTVLRRDLGGRSW